MKTIIFTIGDATLFFTKKKKRWATKTAGKTADAVARNNLTKETVWGIARNAASGETASRTQLGVEWAALRMQKGARPVIIPLIRGGNWLYIERKGPNHFELMIVEPLGTKRTKPKITSKAAASLAISKASKRGDPTTTIDSDHMARIT